MNVLDILRQRLSTFRAHKMRRFPTMFGTSGAFDRSSSWLGRFTVNQKEHLKTLGEDLVIAWGGGSLPDFVPHQVVSRVSIVASLATLSLITCTSGMYQEQKTREMTPVDLRFA